VDIKASIAASREACELLRKMRPATVNLAAAQRGLPSARPSSSTR
jgi:hypothetical protein